MRAISRLNLQTDPENRNAYRICCDCGIVDKFVEHSELTKHWKDRAIRDVAPKTGVQVRGDHVFSVLMEILKREINRTGVKEYLLCTQKAQKFDVSSEYRFLKSKVGDDALVYFTRALLKFREIEEETNPEI
jgi:hypothetical protein